MTLKEQAEHIFSGQKVKVIQNGVVKFVGNGNELFHCTCANDEVKWMSVHPTNNTLCIELQPIEKKRTIITVSELGSLLYSDTNVNIVSCCQPVFWGHAKELATCDWKDIEVQQVYIGAIDKNTLNIEITKIEAL